MTLTSKGIRNHPRPGQRQTADDRAEAERLANSYNASLELNNEKMKQEIGRRFVVTKAYAEDGRLPEVNHYTESELLDEPIHPFIKECIRHDDFDHFQIAYFTHVTTIQLAC